MKASENDLNIISKINRDHKNFERLRSDPHRLVKLLHRVKAKADSTAHMSTVPNGNDSTVKPILEALDKYGD
ncbi:MAG: hypothetical protein GX639_12995 [Fibrobacter sp.]|nr:hypothetical protein [Fibrobacter sp.]